MPYSISELIAVFGDPSLAAETHTEAVTPSIAAPVATPPIPSLPTNRPLAESVAPFAAPSIPPIQDHSAANEPFRFRAADHLPIDNPQAREATDALHMFDPNGYDDWWKCAGYLKKDDPNRGWVGITDGWPVFVEWAKQSAKFDHTENWIKFRDQEASNGGLNALFAEAMRRGWSNPRSIDRSQMLKPPNDVSTSYCTGLTPSVIGPQRFFQRIALIEDKPIEWRIDELIPNDANCALIGPSGAGKTFAAIAMSMAVACGTEFFGMRSNRGPVFYLAGEGKRGIQQRVAAWCTMNEQRIEDAAFYIAASLPPIIDDASTKYVIAELRSMEQECGAPALVVIDTLARAFDGQDENSAAHMGKFISNLDRLRNSFPGATILSVHHTGHDNATRARGSSAFHAALDTEILLKKEENAGLIMKITKQKDAKPAADMPVCLREQETVTGSSLVFCEVLGGLKRSMKGSPKTKPLTDEEKLQVQQYGRDGMSADAIAKRMGISTSTAHKYMKMNGEH